MPHKSSKRGILEQPKVRNIITEKNPKHSV